jgi:hypothetical protein
MSVTGTRPTPPAATNQTPTVPAGPVRAVLPRRRRPGLALAGVVIVVLGFLGTYAYTRATSATRAYLAAARTVTVGAQITDADLRIVDVNAASGLEPIPATQRSKIVGRYARVELVAGSLLTAGQLTDTAIPGPDQQLIGLLLKPSQRPDRTLRPGEPVLLIITSDPRNVTVDPKATASAALPNPPTIKATVAGVGKPTVDGQLVLDVLVSTLDGPGLLERASQGRIAVALTARG